MQKNIIRGERDEEAQQAGSTCAFDAVELRWERYIHNIKQAIKHLSAAQDCLDAPNATTVKTRSSESSGSSVQFQGQFIPGNVVPDIGRDKDSNHMPAHIIADAIAWVTAGSNDSPAEERYDLYAFASPDVQQTLKQESKLPPVQTDCFSARVERSRVGREAEPSRPQLQTQKRPKNTSQRPRMLRILSERDGTEKMLITRKGRKKAAWVPTALVIAEAPALVRNFRKQCQVRIVL